MIFFILALFEEWHNGINNNLTLDTLIRQAFDQLQKALKVFPSDKVKAKFRVKADLKHHWQPLVLARASLLLTITFQVLTVRHLIDKVLQLMILHHLVQPELPVVGIAARIALESNQEFLNLFKFVTLQYQGANVARLDLA